MEEKELKLESKLVKTIVEDYIYKNPLANIFEAQEDIQNILNENLKFETKVSKINYNDLENSTNFEVITNKKESLNIEVKSKIIK